MAKSNHTKESREAIRQAALARHAARREAGALAAGAAAPTTAPYITPPDPPAPEPVVVPDPVAVPAVGTLALNNATAAQANEMSAAQPLGPPPPQLAFGQWLRSREGVDASDTRMSTDRVRMGAELEDRLRIAWMAGFNANISI